MTQHNEPETLGSVRRDTTRSKLRRSRKYQMYVLEFGVSHTVVGHAINLTPLDSSEYHFRISSWPSRLGISSPKGTITRRSLQYISWRRIIRFDIHGEVTGEKLWRSLIQYWQPRNVIWSKPACVWCAFCGQHGRWMWHLTVGSRNALWARLEWSSGGVRG